jgi:hypothetical protein
MHWVSPTNTYDRYADGKGIVAAYQFIAETLCREYGFFRLPPSEQDYQERNYLSELTNFFLQEQDTDKVVDAIELSFRIIDTFTREMEYLCRRRDDPNKRADAAIVELNARFQEHGVGYQFIDREIIRIDSGLIHAEVVKPSLVLLHGVGYAGAQAEFLKAHEHYRHGNAKEALNECLKALESTMKAICDKRGWKYPPTITCNGLIKICFDKNLIPAFWESHFSALKSTLETGVPVVRNKLGGHGQGADVVDVPLHIVGYALHMAASAIVFLASAESSLPGQA